MKTKSEILAEAGFIPRKNREKCKQAPIALPPSLWDRIPAPKSRWIRNLIERTLGKEQPVSLNTKAVGNPGLFEM